ncbi:MULTISPECIES: hypothetical protein [unclassified Mesorhizobium]|uniref:hypothetical protein n=1 Tax=unclassified Mesorhizobium TaxID=325217 RepID=UPI0015E45944|nr:MULTISPECIES: hypothetical protein [unclassified Mesorhizobium]MCA0000985.1 hypothetical protein [Mesorhizobium sp. B264B2A]MCA0004734.1 hypothetical protein [Mesorhizobium sp. B264B1B]MCA0019067.1 hypothetical protein [Mesorhizobium sp. B264B1A]
MPNTAVRAAAEGMPNLNRRTALAATAALIVTAAGSAPAQASPVSAELLALIANKHTQYARFIAAIDLTTELEDAYLPKTAELYVPLSIGGGQSRTLRYGDLEEVEADLRVEIQRRYAEQRQKLVALAKVAPDLGKQSVAALRKAEQADLRTLKRLIKGERARRSAVGLEQAINERNEASDAERYALNAVCAYRCTTMEEHRVKAEFLLEFATGKFGDLQPEDVDALLWSFLPEEALEEAVKAVEGGVA